MTRLSSLLLVVFLSVSMAGCCWRPCSRCGEKPKPCCASPCAPPTAETAK